MKSAGTLAATQIIVTAIFVGCNANRVNSTSQPGVSSEFCFTRANCVFDGRIDAPPRDRRNGWGVLMIGGAFGNDLDWSFPGSLDIDGRRTQLTITGDSHADAPPISGALLERGFVVARWSTIRRDDPLKDRWPIEATVYPLPAMVEHARAALAAFRAQNVCRPDRVILLGHSLGAARACTIAADDDSIAGLILLAPAMLTREGATASNDPRKHGMQWGEDVLKQRAIPTLVICGELDEAQGAHGPAMARLARMNQLAHVDVRIMPNLGHQLGPMLGSRFGPIDPAVLDIIADWAAAFRAAIDKPTGS